ncbi:MAG: hypothetical protein ACI96N_002463, partial [Arenicella sp.]
MKFKMLKAAFAGLVLTVSGFANAAIITISGQGAFDGQWEISEITSTYANAETQLINQIWWGNYSLVSAFAAEYGERVVTSPSYNLNQSFGAFFAYNTEVDNVGNKNLFFRTWRNAGLINTAGVDFANPQDQSVNYTYAVAQRVSAPSTLAILALGLIG